MNDKTKFSLLSTMYFNVNFFQADIPKLLIGGRCFIIDFGYEDGPNFIIRTCDNYTNKQVLYFNTDVTHIDSMTQYSEKESDIYLRNIIYRPIISRTYSDFETSKVLDRFNLYVQYIILSFNYMYWR